MSVTTIQYDVFQKKKVREEKIQIKTSLVNTVGSFSTREQDFTLRSLWKTKNRYKSEMSSLLHHRPESRCTVEVTVIAEFVSLLTKKLTVSKVYDS